MEKQGLGLNAKVDLGYDDAVVCLEDEIRRAQRDGSISILMLKKHMTCYGESG